MTNVMFEIRRLFRPPIQGLALFFCGNPGRCPGLPWIAPLGLGCLAAPAVQFRE